MGEFGAKNVGLDTTEGKWIRQFADYLGKHNTSWTFWAWNPNSGDSGGVLNDDWTTVHADKMALLTSLITKEAIPHSGTVTPSPTPTSASPTPIPTPTSASPTPTPTPTVTGTCTAFKQPYAGDPAYKKGRKVTYNGKAYVSTFEPN